MSASKYPNLILRCVLDWTPRTLGAGCIHIPNPQILKSSNPESRSSGHISKCFMLFNIFNSLLIFQAPPPPSPPPPPGAGTAPLSPDICNLLTNFRLYEVAPLHMCVLSYKHRKILDMLVNLVLAGRSHITILSIKMARHLGFGFLFFGSQRCWVTVKTRLESTIQRCWVAAKTRLESTIQKV